MHHEAAYRPSRWQEALQGSAIKMNIPAIVCAWQERMRCGDCGTEYIAVAQFKRLPPSLKDSKGMEKHSVGDAL